jgi:hypothetical protein
MPRLRPSATGLVGLVLLTGCANTSAVVGTDVPASTSALPASSAAATPDPGASYDSCPSRPASFDTTFLRFGGTNYRGSGQSELKDVDRGAEQFRVGCAADGSAGLPPGTPVYAVRGWPNGCRLIVFNTDAYDLYLADPAPAVCNPDG